MKKTLSSFITIVVLLIVAGAAFASGGGGAEACKPGMLTGLLEKSFGMDCHKAELWLGWLQKAFNFVVLVGLLYWLLAAKMKEFFAGRRVEIKETLEKSVEKKAEAEKKYREYSEKLDKSSTEIDGIFEIIKAQGVTEKQKIIEDAERTAKKMKEDARARIEQELKKAADQLKAQSVQVSVQMAEEILRRSITAQDHETMVKEYMEKVVIKH
jgi:F-type H+-transporting ATPase subunit b